MTKYIGVLTAGGDSPGLNAAIRERARGGKKFSIVAVAEGALPQSQASKVEAADAQKRMARTKEDKQRAKAALAAIAEQHGQHTVHLAQQLESLTGLEARVTILGYLQRGGTPSAADRLLATRLGTACADLINEGVFGAMVAARGEGAEAVPLERVAGNRKLVPLEHPWIASAKRVGTSFGD